MTTVYSGKMWRGKYDETNFAGGKDGAAYAETEPTLANLKAMNYTFNETQELPVAEYNQEAMEAAGQNASTKQTFTTDKTILPGKMVQVVQNADWLEKAIGAGNGSDDGLVPQNSWCEVNYDGKRVKAAYGCYTKTYTLDVPKPKDLPKETVEYDVYDVETVGTPANFSTANVWLTTAAIKHSAFTVTINTVDLLDFESLKLIVTNEYTEKQGGEELHKYPRLSKQSWEVEISTYDYVASLDDLETSAADLFTIVIVGWDGSTVTLTNMKIKPESVNIKEIPEKGMKLYSATYEIGGASTAAITGP